MRQLKIIVLIVSAIFVISGCGSSSEPPLSVPTTYSNSFYPLSVGNYWVYAGRLSITDTLMRADVIDTVEFEKNSYFRVVQSYLGALLGQRPDTLRLRFVSPTLLVRYLNGRDSAYIDFGTFANGYGGPRYPGLIAEYPETDSISLGKFDSCKNIIFRGGAEETFSVFAPNIGEIIRYTPGFVLVQAKIEDKIYK
ncbi:MAG TPA: hypothetical protein VFO76_04840 [Candidatus Kapabacteria bacterium]|nr:hypothetical protein [Candidatus Kapabacteria bacterium]